ncbi:bacterioferritin-associated ferredoxin [Novosphingobium marinum]|uniref:Bacterioferritin-associated ferredoxin n=1 Tax=Novosphingobium marinum TaxID=1514948 RepID=A0A7Z0BUK5_9SPHN|nr:(2Fe-2S)-binding protein [Novosphingobium marinum]NYH96364.1 bacterioferritin-associated ferredoxin [Novosphingobium marinum]GGC34654.1 bacterioferritin-associated ferredoxin [Novosphingobium marinum]
MYVCICNAITESELRSAARQHIGDAESLYTSLGRPPQCRQCLEEAEDILEEARCDRQLPACLPN